MFWPTRNSYLKVKRRPSLMFSGHSVIGAKGKEGKKRALCFGCSKKAAWIPTMQNNVKERFRMKWGLQTCLKAACGCEFSGENLCSLLSNIKVKTNMFPCCPLLEYRFLCNLSLGGGVLHCPVPFLYGFVTLNKPWIWLMSSTSSELSES